MPGRQRDWNDGPTHNSAPEAEVLGGGSYGLGTGHQQEAGMSGGIRDEYPYRDLFEILVRKKSGVVDCRQPPVLTFQLDSGGPPI